MMGGFDDHAAVIGDWMPPSPSPRSFFSSELSDVISSKSIPEPLVENKNMTLFLGPEEQFISGTLDGKGGSQTSACVDQLTKANAFSEQKMSSRGGLLERMAARAGFNAPRLNTESIRPADLSLNQDVRSPYLTIPPGLSPTTLLESPVFLSNSLVQPSPTTGKFPFPPSGNSKSSALGAEASDKNKDNFFEDISYSSFAFKPVAESGPSIFHGAASRLNPSALHPQSFPSIEVSVQPENSLQSINAESAKVQSQSGTAFHLLVDFSRPSIENDVGNTIMSESKTVDTVGGSAENLSPLDEQQDEEAEQRSGGDVMIGGAPAEDGYNWRKYGQKQVKGSEYPRSYYKCTHPNCPVKKKVERSYEGQITEIIYKGTHSHSKPVPNRRLATGPSNPPTDMQLDMPDQTAIQAVPDGDLLWTTMQNGTAGAPDRKAENLEVTSSMSVGSECWNASNTLQSQNATQFDSSIAVDGSSTFSNDEDEDDQHGSVSLGYDGEGDESESKRRKIEAYATEMCAATRAIREPRVVVQTTSEVDILDDGYRWRKYGQKVVKGNPNPRSYYKCTNPGCTVRKHVERASNDLRSVITTYEGKHDHDVPAARNNSHVNSGTSTTQTASVTAAGSLQPHLHRPDPSQVQNGTSRFDRPLPALGSFSLPGRPPLGPPHSFAFGINQTGLANLTMAGLGPSQGKLPVLPVPYLGQQSQVNQMGLMLPKGEPKAEPLSDPHLGRPTGSSLYHQLMSRLSQM